jgi:hypothetical protein
VASFLELNVLLSLLFSVDSLTQKESDDRGQLRFSALQTYDYGSKGSVISPSVCSLSDTPSKIRKKAKILVYLSFFGTCHLSVREVVS